MQEVREKTGLCGSLAMLGLFHPASEDEPKEVKSEQLRNEAHLNCVSLRSRLDYVGEGRAVKGRDERPTGALDSPTLAPRERCRYFLLDNADAFIDGRLMSEIA